MRFRPCIDIHNGTVKQIVGGSLRDEGDWASTNFASELDAAFYAELYQKDGLSGGHIILLNPVGSRYYEETKRQAMEALAAYPGGMQIGGGITEGNARVQGWHFSKRKSGKADLHGGKRTYCAGSKLQKARKRLLCGDRPVAEVY